MSVWIVLTAAALLQQPQVELQTLSGDVRTGTLTQLTADGAVVTTAEGGATIAAEDLLEIRLPGRKPVRPPRSAVEVTLTDGSHFACQDFTLASQTARPTLAGVGEVRFSSRSLDAVRLAPGARLVS